jgi:hypothetical protein
MIFHHWFAPRTYEIGWVLARQFHRPGYATEAARALIDHGFRTLALHRIIATYQPENPPSWRGMEKLGMRREGHFIECIHRGGDVCGANTFMRCSIRSGKHSKESKEHRANERYIARSPTDGPESHYWSAEYSVGLRNILWTSATIGPSRSELLRASIHAGSEPKASQSR